MSRTRPARSPNERDSSAGRPNSLTSSAPATLNRSVIVAFIDAFSPYDSRVIACSRRPIRRAGSTKTGSSTSESAVICQDSENITPAVRTRRDHVGDDAGQRRGERLLGADHVVVEPADQRAGLGAGEEGQRHPLHVVEHPGAQVEDETLADAGRVPPLGEGEDGVEHGQDRDQDRDLHDGGRRAVRADHVHHAAGEHRGDHADHRAGGHGEQEDGQVPPVRPGEAGDPARGPLRQLLFGHRPVAPVRAHHGPRPVATRHRHRWHLPPGPSVPDAARFRRSAHGETGGQVASRPARREPGQARWRVGRRGRGGGGAGRRVRRPPARPGHGRARRAAGPWSR